MSLDEYSVYDLCELIKIAIDKRDLDQAQELLDRLKAILNKDILYL